PTPSGLAHPYIPPPPGTPVGSGFTPISVTPATIIAPAPSARRKLSPTTWLAGLAALLASIALAAILIDRYSGSSSPTTPTELGASASVGDHEPLLREGPRPLAPDPRATLLPTITVRARVGVDGHVHEAVVAHPRASLGQWEARAIEAVRGFRYDPAIRSGVP